MHAESRILSMIPDRFKVGPFQVEVMTIADDGGRIGSRKPKGGITFDESGSGARVLHAFLSAVQNTLGERKGADLVEPDGLIHAGSKADVKLD